MIDRYFLSICSELSILLIANGRISSLQARGIIFSNVHFTIIKEGMMSAKKVFKMGFLSMIAVQDCLWHRRALRPMRTSRAIAKR